MAIAQQMRDLGNQAPQGPQMAAQAQAMAQRNARPVTSDLNGFANGIRPPDPNAAAPNPTGGIPGHPPVDPNLAATIMNPPGSRPVVANPQEALAPRPVPVQAPSTGRRKSQPLCPA